MHGQLGFETPEDFSHYLQSYVDRMDVCLRKNEFDDAEKVLVELVEDLMSRQREQLRPVLDTALEAKEAGATIHEALAQVFSRSEDSL